MLLDIERNRRRSRPRPAHIPRVYRKAPPGDLMLESDGRRYQCEWIERGVTLHSDGNVSCGLDDPHASRSFGDVGSGTIAEIFASPEYDRVRRKLWDGFRCFPCSLYHEVERIEGAPLPDRPTLPATLVAEPSVRCNIRCDNVVCDPNNDRSLATRETEDLDVETFARVIEEIGSGLEKVFFFNYGDPFMHGAAEDMLVHLREHCPDAVIVTSTNGIPLMKAERAARVVESRLNQITFTISGMTQESYVRYHGGGRLDQALQGLRNVCEARQGGSTPRVEWRYLVFNWNDSRDEIDKAIALSREIGVDRFTLMVTHIPHRSGSWRLAPGTPDFQRYRDHIELAEGYSVSASPDVDGFYHPENLPGFGEARWTGWRSRLELPERDGALHLAVSTNRQASRDADHGLLIRTPWQVYRMTIRPDEWSDVVLPVPEGVQGLGPVPIELIAEDVWYPAEELGNGDRRCLGVLIEYGVGRRSARLEPAARDDILKFARR